MSQIYIIAGLLCFIALAVCYVFLQQTMIKKRKEKERLSRALNKRASDLTRLVSCFPEGFLGSELSILLCRSVCDVYEQLAQFEPLETSHLESLKFYSEKMENISRQASEQVDLNLNDSNQINEIRQNLNFLSRFVQTWLQRGNISQKQYAGYKDQIKKLIVKLMVDNYMITANQAEQSQKTKLAIHYYMLAKNLILEEGLTHAKQGHLEQLEERVETLQSQIDSQLQQRVIEKQQSEQTENSDEEGEWGNFSEDEDQWKKKNIYD